MTLNDAVAASPIRCAHGTTTTGGGAYLAVITRRDGSRMWTYQTDRTHAVHETRPGDLSYRWFDWERVNWKPSPG